MDYVIQGEAEESVVEFVDALEGRPRHGDGARPVLAQGTARWSSTRRRGLVPNLDSIPYPAHDLYKITRYTNLQPLTDGLDTKARAYTIMTSRGCPYKCTYCSKPITGDTWRPARWRTSSASGAGWCSDLKATEIGLTDDIWNLKLDRAKELCRRIDRRGAEHRALGHRPRHEGQPRRPGAVPADEAGRLQARRLRRGERRRNTSCAT